MPRIKLSIPKKYDFETNLDLRIYDINYGGHMGNDTVLRIAHEARVRFLHSLDLGERDFYNCSLIIADSAVVYKNEAFYNDKLIIKISVTEFYSYGFELFYLIINEKSKMEIARVKTGLVCYDYNIKKVIKLPSQFRKKFS
tara:strand:- start:37 stop:459 length:423 start_codon:yes stop_codon:yes gene_type:complete